MNAGREYYDAAKILVSLSFAQIRELFQQLKETRELRHDTRMQLLTSAMSYVPQSTTNGSSNDHVDNNGDVAANGDGHEVPSGTSDADPIRRRIEFDDAPEVADYSQDSNNTLRRKVHSKRKSSSLSKKGATRHVQLGSVDLPASSNTFATTSILRKSSSYSPGAGVTGTRPRTASTGAVVGSIPLVASVAAPVNPPITATSLSSSAVRGTVRAAAVQVVYLIRPFSMYIAKVGITSMSLDDLAKRYRVYYGPVRQHIVYFEIVNKDVEAEDLEKLFSMLVRSF